MGKLIRFFLHCSLAGVAYGLGCLVADGHITTWRLILILGGLSVCVIDSVIEVVIQILGLDDLDLMKKLKRDGRK